MESEEGDINWVAAMASEEMASEENDIFPIRKTVYFKFRPSLIYTQSGQVRPSHVIFSPVRTKAIPIWAINFLAGINS